MNRISGVQSKLNIDSHIDDRSFDLPEKTTSVNAKQKTIAVVQTKKTPPTDYVKLLQESTHALKVAKSLIEKYLRDMALIEVKAGVATPSELRILQTQYKALYNTVASYSETVAGVKMDVAAIPAELREGLSIELMEYQLAADEAAPFYKQALTKLFTPLAKLMPVSEAGIISTQALKTLLGEELYVAAEAYLGMTGRVVGELLFGTVGLAFAIVWVIVDSDIKAREAFNRRLETEPVFAAEYKKFMKELSDYKRDKSFHPPSDHSPILHLQLPERKVFEMPKQTLPAPVKRV